MPVNISLLSTRLLVLRLCVVCAFALIFAGNSFAGAIRNGFATNVLPRGDDNSSPSTPLGFSISFGGTSHSSAYVNNNGNITFHAPHSHTNTVSIGSEAFPVLAAYWGFSAQDSSGGNPSFSDLSLAIISTRQSFVRLEPIPIIFQLSNDTNRRVPGHATFHFSCPHVEMFVRNSGGLIQEFKPLSLDRARCVGKDLPMPPGSRTQSTQLLTLDLNRYFPSAGTYRLQAVFRSSSGPEKIRSGWITISISEPQGPTLAAYEFLQRGTDLSRVYERHESDEQRIFFEAFTANYPDSPYAPYIQLNLAGHYLFLGDLDNAKARLERLKGVKGLFLVLTS